MTWELHKVDDIDPTIDDSGVYVVISRVETTRTFKDMVDYIVTVRADLMGRAGLGSYPIVSFIGEANAVRKHLIRFMEEYPSKTAHRRKISREHASYIGYELLRAENTPHYVQD